MNIEGEDIFDMHVIKKHITSSYKNLLGFYTDKLVSVHSIL